MLRSLLLLRCYHEQGPWPSSGRRPSFSRGTPLCCDHQCNVTNVICNRTSSLIALVWVRPEYFIRYSVITFPFCKYLRLWAHPRLYWPRRYYVQRISISEASLLVFLNIETVWPCSPSRVRAQTCAQDQPSSASNLTRPPDRVQIECRTSCLIRTW